MYATRFHNEIMHNKTETVSARIENVHYYDISPDSIDKKSSSLKASPLPCDQLHQSVLLLLLLRWSTPLRKEMPLLVGVREFPSNPKGCMTPGTTDAVQELLWSDALYDITATEGQIQVNSHRSANFQAMAALRLYPILIKFFSSSFRHFL